MKRLLYLSLILLAHNYSNCQNNSIDSLKQKLNSYQNKAVKTFSDDTSAVRNYLKIANGYRLVSKDTMLHFSTEANKLAAKIKWSEGLAESEYMIAAYYNRLPFDLDTSLYHYQKALVYLPDMPAGFQKELLSAKITYQFGIAYFNHMQYELSLSYLLKAKESLSELKINGLFLNTCGHIGKAYTYLHQDSLAVVYYREGKQAAIEQKDSVMLGIIVGNLGINLTNLGKYEEAESELNQALDIDTKRGNVGGQLRHLSNLALIYRYRGELTEAKELLLLSLQIAYQINSPVHVAYAKNHLSKIYHLLGQFSTAIKCAEESLELYLEQNMATGISACQSDLCINYMSLGNYPLSIEYALQSIATVYQYGLDTSNTANDIGNIALVYNMLGYYDLALTYNMRAQEIFTSTNDIEHMAVGLGNMGNLYLKMGQNEKALESFQKAISISSQIGLVGTVAINLSAIGSLYNEEEKFDLALQKYFDALQIYQSMNYEGLFSSAYSNIALAYLNLGKSDSALENAHTSLSFAVEQKNPVDLVYASRVLYLIYLKQQNPQRAFEQLTRIRQLVLKGIETSFFSLSENEREPYLNQQTVFLDAYHDYGLHYYKTTPQLTDTMYNMVLGIKGLSMRSSTAMRTAILNSNDSLLLADYDALIALKKKIADGFAKGENTSVSESEARELEKKIIKQSGLMSNFEKLKNTDWKIVQKSLDKDAAAIEFYHFKSTIDTSHAIIYMALIITHDCEHPILVELCTEDDLKKIFGAFQGNNLSFVERVYGKKSEAKRELYEKIWQPLEPYLQDVKTVYYSPSGLLHKVSFAAICKEQDVYLSDVYNFRQMGSTGNLAFENNTEFGDLENFLLMGGVQYNSDTTEKEIWNYLPGSLAETDAINSYLNKKKYGVNYFKETNASEAIFKEKISSSSIVHIATHGFFFPDPEQVREEMKSEKESDELKFRGTTNYANWSFVNNKNPLMRSGIVLANANDVWQRNPLAEGEDGILTAQEVSNLDLRNTKLVVLSACETGLGDIKGSEGVYGLQRAFKMAGVKYLIMSLWQVPDKETSEFMILFYKNLIKEKDIPTSFQKTQKVMREKYDPYYWGAFTLIE